MSGWTRFACVGVVALPEEREPEVEPDESRARMPLRKRAKPRDRADRGPNVLCQAARRGPVRGEGRLAGTRPERLRRMVGGQRRDAHDQPGRGRGDQAHECVDPRVRGHRKNLAAATV